MALSFIGCTMGGCLYQPQNGFQLLGCSNAGIVKARNDMDMSHFYDCQVRSEDECAGYVAFGEVACGWAKMPSGYVGMFGPGTCAPSAITGLIELGFPFVMPIMKDLLDDYPDVVVPWSDVQGECMQLSWDRVACESYQGSTDCIWCDGFDGAAYQFEPRTSGLCVPAVMHDIPCSLITTGVRTRLCSGKTEPDEPPPVVTTSTTTSTTTTSTSTTSSTTTSSTTTSSTTTSSTTTSSTTTSTTTTSTSMTESRPVHPGSTSLGSTSLGTITATTSTPGTAAATTTASGTTSTTSTASGTTTTTSTASGTTTTTTTTSATGTPTTTTSSTAPPPLSTNPDQTLGTTSKGFSLKPIILLNLISAFIVYFI